ncbi:MAG: exonuclease SbcCD subunit D [Hydrogenoanaerobacterium sp.]
MRIVHTSDWHIGKMVNGLSMLDDQKYIIEQIINFLVEQQAELLIIAGDLYDRSIPPTEAVALLDDALYRITTQAGIPVIAVSGNHDSPQRLAFASRLYENAGLYIEGVYNKEIRKITLTDEFGRVNFFCLPYIEPAIVRADFPQSKIHSYDDAMRAVIEYNLPRIDTAERNVIITHGFFSYLKNPNDVIRSDSEITLGGSDLIDAKYLEIFDYAALGHLHRPQKTGPEKIRYSGSPLKYSVSESSGAKSITTLVLREKNDLSIKHFELAPLHNMRVIQGSFEALCGTASLGEGKNDYVYAKLSDDSLIPGAMEKLRCVYPNIIGLELVGRQHENEASLAAAAVKAKEPSVLFDEFYTAVKGDEITKERMKIAKELFNELKGGEF